MDKKKWIEQIEQACKDAGTYRPFFDAPINTLAGILERRDKAEAKFKEDGSRIVVEHYGDRAKAPNLAKNPILLLINDLNAQALAYWRDLGLTPAGYKKLNADVVKENGSANLEAALAEMLKG